MDAMELLTQSNGNFKELRSKHDSIKGPTVPYIGMFLTDLTFVEEGNPSSLKDGLINFSKWRLVSKILKRLHKYQQNLYNFDAVPIIQGVFKVALFYFQFENQTKLNYYLLEVLRTE